MNKREEECLERLLRTGSDIINIIKRYIKEHKPIRTPSVLNSINKVGFTNCKFFLKTFTREEIEQVESKIKKEIDRTRPKKRG